MRSTSEPTIDLSDAAILRLRAPKNVVDPRRPYAFFVEKERSAKGRVEDVATLFLTNRECAFRCLMCDLWKNTTDAPVPLGAIPEQIRWALDQVPPARHIKLYNSGSFFDPNAIPVADYPTIATMVSPFETVVVESHPRMIGDRCLDFNRLLVARLQVAMGLETVDRAVLAKLNKQMTPDDFASAVKILSAHDIPVRAFILLRLPYQSESDGVIWAKRSIEFAFDTGVECCVVIPTRAGNGVMESLTCNDLFEPPSLASLEEILEYGILLRCGRVFVDLWDVGRLACDAMAASARIARLQWMNLNQEVPSPGAPLGPGEPTR